jgi:hypothetical protein
MIDALDPAAAGTDMMHNVANEIVVVKRCPSVLTRVQRSTTLTVTT